MNISSEMSIAATAPPPVKAEVPKTSDGDSTFQQTLDAKVQVVEENRKQATENEKNADVIAGAGAVKAQATPVVPIVSEAINLAAQAIGTDLNEAGAGNKSGATLSLLNQQGLQARQVIVAETPVETQPVKVQTPIVQSAPIEMTTQITIPAKAPTEVQGQTNPNDIMASLEASQTGTATGSKSKIELVLSKASEEKPLVIPQNQVSGDSKVQLQAFSNALSIVNKQPVVPSTPIMQQVIDGIKGMVDRGQNTLRLQIHPENMGRIEMKLVSGSEGVQVFITADKASTKSLLESNLSQLQQSLQNAGVKLGGMNVGHQNNQGNSSSWQASTQSNPYSVSLVTGQEEPVASHKWNLVGSLSALDARI